MKRSISAWRRTHSPGSSAEWRRARLSSQQQDRFHLLPRSLAGDFDRTSAPSQSSSTPRGSSSLMLCCGGRRWRSGSWRPTRMSSRTRSGIQCKSLSSRTRSGIQCHALTGLRIRSAMTGRNKLGSGSKAVIPGSTRDPGSPGTWIADQVRNDNIKSSIISFVSPNKKHKW